MKQFVILLLSAIIVTACGTAGTPSQEPAATSTADAATALVPDPATADPFQISTATAPAAPSPTPTPVGPVIRVAEQDGMPQVRVPQGELHMGGLDVHAENDELPDHVVQIPEFWIDQLEVTNGMYGLCVQAGVCPLPQKLSSPRRPAYFHAVEFQDYPVMQVTWTDANAYCAWAGRRLPTEAEWERAARGGDLRTYPWGDEPPTEKYANFDNLVRDTSRVGSYAPGASPFGALDMAGNVWEWVADLYDQDYYLTAPTANPTGGSPDRGRYERVIRGGSYQDVGSDIRVSNRGYELGPNPTAPYDSRDVIGRSSVKIGFRCAADP